jgi:hypothetical protein
MPSSISSEGSEDGVGVPVEKSPWRQGAVHATRVMNSRDVTVHPMQVLFKVRRGADITAVISVIPLPQVFALANPGRAQDVEIDTLYMLRINVKNNSHKSHRVKIVPPATNDFRLLFVPNRPLAPGLEMVAEIEFRARENHDYIDRIIIESDDDSIEVPLRAFMPRPELELDSFIDFGMVALGASNTVEVNLTNVGSRCVAAAPSPLPRAAASGTASGAARRAGRVGLRWVGAGAGAGSRLRRTPQ